MAATVDPRRMDVVPIGSTFELMSRRLPAIPEPGPLTRTIMACGRDRPV
jgi:hypothetical protein